MTSQWIRFVKKHVEDNRPKTQFPTKQTQNFPNTLPRNSKSKRNPNISTYLASNHNSQPPSSPHLEPSQSAPPPQCSDLWPSCCPHPTAQKRNYRVGKSGRTVPIWRCPWCQAPDPWALPWARTSHNSSLCSTHWLAPVAAPCRLGSALWSRCRAQRRPPPRTWLRSGSHIAHPERARFHAFFREREWVLEWERWGSWERNGIGL